MKVSNTYCKRYVNIICYVVHNLFTAPYVFIHKLYAICPHSPMLCCSQWKHTYILFCSHMLMLCCSQFRHPYVPPCSHLYVLCCSRSVLILFIARSSHTRIQSVQKVSAAGAAADLLFILCTYVNKYKELCEVIRYSIFVHILRVNHSEIWINIRNHINLIRYHMFIHNLRR